MNMSQNPRWIDLDPRRSALPFFRRMLDRKVRVEVEEWQGRNSPSTIVFGEWHAYPEHVVDLVFDELKWPLFELSRTGVRDEKPATTGS